MADLALLDVKLHGQSVGTLTRLDGDRVLFAFTAAYINDAERPTLSLSFKDRFGQLITDIRPTQTRVPSFFSNLLPEGPLREYLAQRAGVNAEREFFLLWVLGQDLPGALQIVPAEGSVLPHEIADATSAVDDAKSEAFALRFSLAGVQLKFSAIQKATGGLTIPVDGVGGSWIVKLPSTKFDGVPENEFAMMELARRVGIDVPETQLIPLTDVVGLPKGIELVGDKAFAIRRFDRQVGGPVIHMEDFAQVFGVYPARKYERASYRSIAKVLWVETGEPGIVEFTRRLIFNALIGNADMHLKNWSLSYSDRRTAFLSPAYDFVSTIACLPGDKMALTFADSKDFASVSLEQVERFAEKSGLREKLVLDTAKETVIGFADAWRDSADFTIHDKVRRAIDAGLKTIPLWREVAR